MPDKKPNTSTLTDRFRALFVRDTDSSMFEAEPRHKGLVITFCILTASLLWFAFSMQETYTQVIEMPVEVQNLPSDQALVSVPPSAIRVQVEGEGVQLLRLYYRPPTVSLDAADADLDMELVTSKAVKSVSIHGVTPRTISLATENRIERRVPIRPRVEINPASGHRIISGPELRPDSVMISGAASIISSITSWPTEHVVRDNVRDTVRVSVALSDTLSMLVDKSESITEYFASVQEFTEGGRTLEVKVRGAPTARRVSFNPPEVTVRYLVPLSQYDDAKESDGFIAWVPYSDIRSDTSGVLYPRLDVPEDLEIREPRIQPDALRYYNVLGDN